MGSACCAPVDEGSERSTAGGSATVLGSVLGASAWFENKVGGLLAELWVDVDEGEGQVEADHNEQDKRAAEPARPARVLTLHETRSICSPIALQPNS